jgi:hypothetical protein
VNKEKALLQASMLKYAKSVILLSDDVTPDNAFQMLSVVRNGLKYLEKSIYKRKGKRYNNEYREDYN